jgi:CubicO group peptidase (beta-lactamase class C family)
MPKAITLALFLLPALVGHGEEIPCLSGADQRRVDAIVAEFQQTHDIPGLSIAFTKDGRPVFAQGYGYADKDKKVPVTTSHLFRIASVSKPITSIAIFTLVEQGKLNSATRSSAPAASSVITTVCRRAFPRKAT